MKVGISPFASDSPLQLGSPDWTRADLEATEVTQASSNSSDGCAHPSHRGHVSTMGYTMTRTRDTSREKARARLDDMLRDRIELARVQLHHVLVLDVVGLIHELL